MKWTIYLNVYQNIYTYLYLYDSATSCFPVNDSNVQFMEKSKDSNVGALYMALPFTRGQAFIVSVLDAILSLVNK